MTGADRLHWLQAPSVAAWPIVKADFALQQGISAGRPADLCTIAMQLVKAHIGPCQKL